ncbi:hypothetical protein KAR91_83130 [Candidatus Pacearchaeota archaeon]|nr:hypothetical protein [Candidatus Pacearchaeota archaeon]
MKKTGGMICKHYTEEIYYKEMSTEIESWEPTCEKRLDDVEERFKTFPCKRKLGCFEPKEIS